MRRLPFLPVFFVALSIIFVVVLVARLRREMREENTMARVAAGSAPAQPATRLPATAPIRETSNRPAVSPPRTQGVTAGGSKPLQHRPSVPPPTAPPAAPTKSALARLFAPIIRGFGGGSSSQTSGSTPSQSSGQSQSTASRAPQKDAQTQKDPNSDNTPPQLLSIEFVPPQVRDGEEATVVVMAVDDLSGVKAVSGTISSPTGKALQGFATQRDGETNRYAGRVTIAKSAEEGLWKVSFLNLMDNASNSVTLSYAQGTIPPNAVLRVVSSDSDSTAPVLKNVWVDRRAIRGGEKDTVFVEAVDDKSGVNLVSCVFQSPSRIARIGAGCTRGQNDIWECELNAPTCLDCGDWQLEQVTLQDKANNLATFRLDNPLVRSVKVNIQGDSCDATPPALQSLVLDSHDVIMGHDSGAIVTVTIVVSDDICGVLGISGQFSGPGAGSGGFFPLQQAGDPSTWTGRIQLDPHVARGLWRINSIQLTDRGHNLRIYSSNDPLLQNAVFHIR